MASQVIIKGGLDLIWYCYPPMAASHLIRYRYWSWVDKTNAILICLDVCNDIID